MPVRGTLEEQYSFLLIDYDSIIYSLEDESFVKIEYPHETVLTIYFSDEEHRVPKSAYIRARKYASESCDEILNVEMNSIFNLEIKSKSLSNRKKHKTEISFGNIVNIFSNALIKDNESSSVIKDIWSELELKKLIPFVATQYMRKHYEKNGLRVTLDIGIKVYGFEKKSSYEAVKIWEDVTNGKFEIKSDVRTSEINVAKTNLLSRNNLKPTALGSAEKNYRKYYADYFSKESKSSHSRKSNFTVSLSE